MESETFHLLSRFVSMTTLHSDNKLEKDGGSAVSRSLRYLARLETLSLGCCG